MQILAIDPGNVESAYAIINMPDFELLEFEKCENNELLSRLNLCPYRLDVVAIEMIASYGMAVGKDVFETCVWIGRFEQKMRDSGIYKDINYVYRRDEKMTLCGSMKAKDANVRQALIDRYAKHDFKNGKGRKDNPDTFYGVSADVWQAIAVGVTYWEANYGTQQTHAKPKGFAIHG